MAGPWEAYGGQAVPSSSGPWSQYAAPQARYSPEDVDAVVRTTAFEETDPKAQQGVASVILNRAASKGQPARDIVTAPGQFEPWSARRPEVEGLDPSSPKYQATLANIQNVISNGPVTNATHFYAPKAQGALGRAPPSWDDGSGLDVGDSRFFTNPEEFPPAAAPQAAAVTPGNDRVFDPTTGVNYGDAQAATLRGIQSDIDMTGPAPTYKGFPIQASKDGAVPQGPGVWYVTPTGELKQNPVTVDEGLGFAKGAFKPLDNAAWAVDQGLRKTGFPVQAVDDFFARVGMPSTGEAIDQRREFLAQQALKGIVPGKLGEFGGNVAGTLPLAMLPGGAAVQGAAGGALLTDSSSVGGVARDATIGAIGGKVGDWALRGAAGTIRGVTDPALQLLRKEGVPLTLGQMSNNRFVRGLEDKATSIPGLGDVIKSAQRRSYEGMNRAAINRSLEPIGEAVPKGMAGHDAIEFAQTKLSDKYDALLPALKVQADQPFAESMGNLMELSANLDQPRREVFENIMKREVIGRFSEGGGMTGETMKRVESDLTKHIWSIRKNPMSSKWDHDMADALQEARDQLRQLVMRNNPDRAPELEALNKGWANYKVVEKAAASDGAVDGIFTPAMLDRASRASVGQAGKAQGRGVMRDLSKAARSTLPPTIPNSGSTDRALVAMFAGAAGGHFVPPAMPLVAAGAGVAGAYMPAGRALSELLLMARPKGAGMLADQLPKLKAPAVAAGSAAMVNSRK